MKPQRLKDIRKIILTIQMRLLQTKITQDFHLGGRNRMGRAFNRSEYIISLELYINQTLYLLIHPSGNS